MHKKTARGFTLIEMLVVLAIIAIVITVALIAFKGAQASGRDTKRKADLQDIRSALEIYRTDCGSYPASLTLGSPLTATCVGSSSSTYMSSVPNDPLNARDSTSYAYTSTSNTYTLCARLENGSGAAVCGVNACGPNGACNYSVTNP